MSTTLSSPKGSFSTTFVVDSQPGGTKVITARDRMGNFATTTFYIPTIIAISISTNTIGFGIQDLNAWTGTKTFSATNTGNVLERFTIRLGTFTDGINQWSISLTNGDNRICAKYSINSGISWEDITSYDTDLLLKNNVDINENVIVEFKIMLPTSTASYNEYNAGLTITGEKEQ
ncbi:MAG: hypothetical protein AB1630_05235 [bacterium]